MAPTNNNEIDDKKNFLPIELYESLTDGARRYFYCSVKEYADKLLNEATNIEKMERAGTGDPEITAAHVEEAKWVIIRRLRRSSSKLKWVVALRLGQTLGACAIGVGASNFSQTWGAVMCVISIFFGSLMLIFEREISRDI
jgi:hypothetical protein